VTALVEPPLGEDIRSRTTPYVTRILILINIIAFIPIAYSAFFPENTAASQFVDSIYNTFSMVPADFLAGRNLFTLVTCMFLHADIFHIGGNMLYFYIFGDNVEDAFGHLPYLVFYFAAGIVAGLTYILSVVLAAGDLTIPVLGASGAISGVMGAYGLLYPRARIRTWFLFFVVNIPAIIYIGSWFVLQLLYTVLDIQSGVAYWAHIGGFVFGAFIALVYMNLKGKASN